jgi:putative Mn2+ efflux pump MntP
MEIIIITIILATLSIQVLPVAMGIDIKSGLGKSIWFALVLLLGQLLMFVAGYHLGERFMHLLDNYVGTVIFVGFFLVGIRFIMDAFKVRKGERTYIADNSLTVILASLAQGINTFLAGILFSSITDNSEYPILVLLAATILVITPGLFMKSQKQNLVITSLLYFAGGIVLITGSVYLGFIL